ncbi:hypothetical protein EUTSA_v10002812mg [Eutrema salsugineum]|uniref:Uncharacterized protein n=1 Tax=Eutrema salsugineum TaxID=72664 RepID=V4LAZ6_EUTSA|nr:hypothetical protein EUTSA_v10002812mg [Eutrema salsugineum]
MQKCGVTAGWFTCLCLIFVGRHLVCLIIPLILKPREEIVFQPYAKINRNRGGHLCAKIQDTYCPHPQIQDIIWDCLYSLSRFIHTGHLTVTRKTVNVG